MKFMNNMDNIGKPPERPKTPAWKIDPPPSVPTTADPDIKKKAPDIHPKIPSEKINFPPGCARIRLRRTEGPIVIKPEGINNPPNATPKEIVIEPESLLNVKKHLAELHGRTGKNRTRQILADEALAAEEEIKKAIKKLYTQLDESEFQE